MKEYNKKYETTAPIILMLSESTRNTLDLLE